MEKLEVLKKLYEKKGEASDEMTKERLDNICNLIEVLSEEDIKAIPEIETYLNGSVSRLDSDILKTIMNKAISKKTNTILTQSNGKTRKWMWIFLVPIILLAIVTIPFAIVHFILGDGFCYGRGNDIATLLGTLDFSIGAIGFVLERRDDMKKKELQSAGQVARETGEVEKFTSFIIKNCGNKSIKQKNKYGDNVAGDKHC